MGPAQPPAGYGVCVPGAAPALGSPPGALRARETLAAGPVRAASVPPAWEYGWAAARGLNGPDAAPAARTSSRSSNLSFLWWRSGGELHQRGDQRHRSHRREFFVQRVAEAARLILSVDFLSRPGLFPHPLQQLVPRQLLRGLDRPVIALDRGDHEVQIRIQPHHKTVELPRLVSRAGFGVVVAS